MRLRRKMTMKRVPIFPLIPLVPMVVIGSLVTAIRALVRVRRLEQKVAGGGAPA
jgi:hypothetical protein